ncbi:MAG: carbohydrate binding family 9 domain-containing protein [Archangium sp.]
MAAVLMASVPAFAAIEGPGINQFLQAERITAPIRLDGLLDEPGWQAAPRFDSFVQLFPDEGAAPTERTELRVLYDDQNLYVGVICHDSQPELIARPLGRRDKPPPNSDFVLVGIDSAHDHRTAFAFQVTAGGVLLDTLFYADNKYTDEWDAVWDAAVAERSDGWSLEMLIPLSVLRFPTAPVQTWGFSVQRHISRKHEDVLTV